MFRPRILFVFANMPTGRELVAKTSDAHNPAPKIARAGGQVKDDGAGSTDSAAGSQTALSKVMETLRSEMHNIFLQNKSDMLEMKVRLDSINGRMDGIHVSMETAVGAVIQTTERHGQQLFENEETLLRLEKHIQRQTEVSAKMQADIDAFRGAQSEAARTVPAVRAEMAMPADAPFAAGP